MKNVNQSLSIPSSGQFLSSIDLKPSSELQWRHSYKISFEASGHFWNENPLKARFAHMFSIVWEKWWQNVWHSVSRYQSVWRYCLTLAVEIYSMRCRQVKNITSIPGRIFWGIWKVIFENEMHFQLFHTLFKENIYTLIA